MGVHLGTYLTCSCMLTLANVVLVGPACLAFVTAGHIRNLAKLVIIARMLNGIAEGPNALGSLSARQTRVSGSVAVVFLFGDSVAVVVAETEVVTPAHRYIALLTSSLQKVGSERLVEVADCVFLVLVRAAASDGAIVTVTLADA